MAKKKPPSTVKTLDSFFKPASVPPTPTNKSTARPKTPASTDKGKRKAIATIDLDSSDDDVEIIERGPSKKVAREGAVIRGVNSKTEAEDTPVAGPSKCFFDSDDEDKLGGMEAATVEEVVEADRTENEADAVKAEQDATVEILDVDIEAWGDDVAEGERQDEDESQDVGNESGEVIEEDNWGEESMPTIDSPAVDDDDDECTIVQGSSKDLAPATEDSCPICCEVLTALSKSVSISPIPPETSTDDVRSATSTARQWLSRRTARLKVVSSTSPLSFPTHRCLSPHQVLLQITQQVHDTSGSPTPLRPPRIHPTSRQTDSRTSERLYDPHAVSHRGAPVASR